MDDAKLTLLQKASEQLIKILDIDRLLQYILEIAKQGVEADRGTVYVVDQKRRELWSKVLIGENLSRITLPIGAGIAGHVAATGETLNIEDAYTCDKFNKQVDHVTGYRTTSILCMPIRNSNNEIVGVLQMLNKKHGRFLPQDEEFLTSLSNYSSIALELARLHEELLEKKRMEYELNIARKIQMSLLPKNIPQISSYALFGTNISCEVVSGDYYDCYPIGADKWLLVIGDVSGKGIPAALMMATLQSHLKAIMKKFDGSITETMCLLNEYIRENSLYEKYITLFIGILDSAAHTFTYVNAGHTPPVLVSAQGQVALLRKGDPVIGLLAQAQFHQEQLSLQPGDLIFCYTDGVTEHMNSNDEEFGEERLYAFLQQYYPQALSAIFENLKQTLRAFGQGQAFRDDLTILMLRRKL